MTDALDGWGRASSRRRPAPGTSSGAARARRDRDPRDPGHHARRWRRSPTTSCRRASPSSCRRWSARPGERYRRCTACARWRKVCIAREFTHWALQQTSPIIAWLRALAPISTPRAGGPGVGAVGMCFSGGFALGMMVDDVMVAPVLSQPSLPFAVGKAATACRPQPVARRRAARGRACRRRVPGAGLAVRRRQVGRYPVRLAARPAG